MQEERLAQLLAEVQALPATPTGPHLSDEEYVAFILEELAPDQEARIDAHLATCPECTQRLGVFFAAEKAFPEAAWEQQHVEFVQQLRAALQKAGLPTSPAAQPAGDSRAPRRWSALPTGLGGPAPVGVGMQSTRKRTGLQNPHIIAIGDYIERKSHWSRKQQERYLELLEHDETLIQAAAGPPPSNTGRLDESELVEPSRIVYTAIPKTGVTRWRLGPETLGSGAALRIVSANGMGAWIDRGALYLEGHEVVIDNARLPAAPAGVFVVTPTDRYQRGRSAVFVIEPRPVEVGTWSVDALVEDRYAVEAWRRKTAEEGAIDELALFLLLEVFDKMVIAMQNYPQETLEDWGLVRHWHEMIRELDPWRDRLRQYVVDYAKQDSELP